MSWDPRAWIATIRGGTVGGLSAELVGDRQWRYVDAAGTFIGTLTVRGPIEPLGPTEGHYEAVFQEANGKFHTDRVPMSAMDS